MLRRWTRCTELQQIVELSDDERLVTALARRQHYATIAVDRFGRVHEVTRTERTEPVSGAGLLGSAVGDLGCRLKRSSDRVRYSAGDLPGGCQEEHCGH